MDIIKILNKIDSRIIYLLISIVVLIPLLIKIPVTIEPDDYSSIVYKNIDEILNPKDVVESRGSNINELLFNRNSQLLYDVPSNSEKTSSGSKKVLMSFDYGPSTIPEVGPMSYAIMRQVISSGNEVHTVALWDTGLPMISETKKNVLKDLGIDEKDAKIYDFGFKSGGESVIRGMLSNIPKIFPKAQGIVESLCDYDFVISFSAGAPGSKEWVQFAGDQSASACGGKKIKVSTGVTAVQVTELLPYVSDSNDAQLTGILAGLSGAASYETLTGFEGEFAGKASQRMNAQSFAHILIILFIIVGNIAYFILNRRES
ncbi:MAG: hypothetical protein CMG13_00870 [Candidatus Marinimicrobia bacterium]|nr:hypothetical protein [Candidatus Neomarinimicrobiota bacterium]